MSPQIATLFSLIRSPARGAPHKGSRPFLHSVISLLRPHIPVKPLSLVLLVFPFLVLVDSGLNRGTGIMLPRTSWPTLEQDILLNLPHKSSHLLPDKLLRLHQRETIRLPRVMNDVLAAAHLAGIWPQGQRTVSGDDVLA